MTPQNKNIRSFRAALAIIVCGFCIISSAITFFGLGYHPIGEVFGAFALFFVLMSVISVRDLIRGAE